ncbi:unnamed protein product [Rhizophagus irregularis]|uniref:Uncharacterized protein n=1 Tax=Rhizophagus irregularis TaxID=588596 RepID=A0A916E1W4_9GLOM|nr:unnamed protein product [Rhizophagus irregularis]
MSNNNNNKKNNKKNNKQKQQRFQEETPDKGSNRQRKEQKKKQQRFQEETPSEGSKRQRGRMEEESDPNETSDKTNKSTSKSAHIKSILKSAKSTKLTQEESDDKAIEIEPPNIPKDQQEMLSEMKKRYGNIRILQKFVLVVKDDQGNEKVIDYDDTNLEAGTILTLFV